MYTVNASERFVYDVNHMRHSKPQSTIIILLGAMVVFDML